MAESLLTLTGKEVTLDQTAGLQTSGVPTTTEDNNDSDVAALSSAIATQLTTAAAADGKTIPGTAVGFAVSDGNVVTVTSTSLNDIAFTDGAGAPLNGADSELTTLAGNRILLYSSGSNNNIVYGIEEDTGDLVFALILEETTTNGVTTGAKIWSALYEPIAHDVDGAPSIANHDDVLDLTNKLFVTANEDLTFNFDELPSGANLFGVVGTSSTAPAIIVIGENIDLLPPNNKGLSKYSNISDTIHTSQGGTGATIGVNNQLFDNVSEGAYFTYVNNPVQNFLSGAPGGLNSTEADFADNIQYTGGTLQVSSAFFVISQMQGNDLADVKITAYDIADDPQGIAFVDSLGTGTTRNITAVRVFDETGTKIEDTDDLANFNDPNVNVDLTGLTATVTGLDAGYKVEWDTDGLHDQVLIENVGGQFDIGLFGVNQAGTDTDEVGSKVNFEDDGPTIGPIANSIVDFAVGESAGPESLHGAPGTDDNSTYTITPTGFTPSIVVNGVTVIGELSDDAHTVTYFDDKNDNDTFDSGVDTKYYTLALDPTDPGAYTFTVNAAPPAPPLEFNFDELPSGANLFGVVGTSDEDPAIIVIGEDIDLLPPNNKDLSKYSNISDTIHTSQGGTGATIGVNNQLFDNVSEGAYFTYVNNPVQNFLSGAPGGLTATEADFADNIQYTGGTNEVGGAFFVISQMQGNDLADVKITAYDIADDPQGIAFVDSLGTGTTRNITAVRVFDETGTKIEDTDDLANFNDPNVNVDLTGLTATVTGLDAGYKVEWDTDGLHDQVLIENVGGQFDIGLFGISQPQETNDQKLDFTVQIADGDGDTDTANFSIGIDGNHDGTVAGVLIV